MHAALGPVASLLAGVGILLTGHGLLNLLLPLRATAEGFGTLIVGVFGAAFFGGFVAGCVVGPRIVRRVGHIRCFAAMVSTLTALALLHPLVVSGPLWVLLRALFGSALAVAYLVVESWLNERAGNSTRGTVMSAYIVVNFGGITAGQMLLPTGEVGGFGLFALSAVLLSVAALPVTLTRAAQPAPVAEVAFRPLRLYRASPVGLLGALLIGVTNGAFWTVGPVAATGYGLSESGAAMFMTAAALAGALAQWPAGRLSDRTDRRRVLVGMLFGASAAGLVLGLATDGPWLLPLAAAFGALALPCYAIAAAHAYDLVPADEYVDTASSLLLVNGAGAAIGPVLAAACLLWLPGGGLFLFTAAVHAALLGFVLWRLRARPPAAGAAGREPFDLAATAPAAIGAVIPPDDARREGGLRPVAPE
ncbi:MAG: MFS transporter [Acetobacteraceae bacterium]|nr:MFS transporter [Acetobacteraceae bacterium]MDW8397538.1 MFS transporter [Acetobacteraceae bacterium]